MLSLAVRSRRLWGAAAGAAVRNPVRMDGHHGCGAGAECEGQRGEQEKLFHGVPSSQYGEARPCSRPAATSVMGVTLWIAPRLVAGEELRRRAPSRLILEIDVKRASGTVGLHNVQF